MDARELAAHLTEVIEQYSRSLTVVNAFAVDDCLIVRTWDSDNTRFFLRIEVEQTPTTPRMRPPNTCDKGPACWCRQYDDVRVPTLGGLPYARNAVTMPTEDKPLCPSP